MADLRLLQRPISGVEAAVGDVVDVAEWRLPNLRSLERTRHVVPVPEDHPAYVPPADLPAAGGDTPQTAPASPRAQRRAASKEI